MYKGLNRDGTLFTIDGKQFSSGNDAGRGGEIPKVSSRFTSPPLYVDARSRDPDFLRADVVFEGVDQSGPSYEIRVFLNNPHADHHTAPIPENGYAGSFHVYGYGLWPGKEAARGGESRAPMTRYLVATEPLRAALATGDTVTVTAVPVPHQAMDSEQEIDMGIQRVSISVDRPPPGREEAS